MDWLVDVEMEMVDMVGGRNKCKCFDAKAAKRGATFRNAKLATEMSNPVAMGMGPLKIPSMTMAVMDGHPGRNLMLSARLRLRPLLR